MDIFSAALGLIFCYFWVASVFMVAWGMVEGFAIVCSPFFEWAQARERSAKKREAYNKLTPEEKEWEKKFETMDLLCRHKKYLKARVSRIASGFDCDFSLAKIANMHDFDFDDDEYDFYY